MAGTGAWCALLALVTASGFQQCLKESDAPWFCHDLDCPPFDVVETLAEDIELRSYDAGVWVSTNVTGVKYSRAVSTGFMRLFAYISGANGQQARIPMTAPVRVQLTPGAGPFCEDSFKVSFYVPPDMQADPPAPLEEDVFIDPTPAADYYVLSYGGRTHEKEILDKASELLAVLDEQRRQYDYSHFFSAGYDSPFRLLNRHNEVWIPARAPAARAA